ncbi:MAG: hypothetical protein AW10_01846 [Candidatus Accumulibacter appositus]|uniref:Uncharacterized protein n=1 Tax=Candidatus Accumulibacter appositus TaxID=1454003 RepID=A0A011PU26_9PROT|nr:MAG: hypothetical protein AW10_01846 [Candidatus Accumulibacter appositus]
MIYVKRDPSLIPEKVLKVAERAQQTLESLMPNRRKAFIEQKAHIWRAFGRHLAKMSYGKCWYSESNDPQSFFDVDHFRPKKEAKRAEGVADDGYPWLAFSWENFRYSAGRSNRLNTDDATAAVLGKGSWFPLLEGSVRANWTNRCEDKESAVLLDPTNRDDVGLIEINSEDGRATPSVTCVGQAKQERAKRSIEIYGLNLGNLITARKRVMRDLQDDYLTLMEICSAGTDMAAVSRLQNKFRRATLPSAPYSRAARAKMHSLPYGPKFCAQPEDEPEALA